MLTTEHGGEGGLEPEGIDGKGVDGEGAGWGSVDDCEGTRGKGEGGAEGVLKPEETTGTDTVAGWRSVDVAAECEGGSADVKTRFRGGGGVLKGVEGGWGCRFGKMGGPGGGFGRLKRVFRSGLSQRIGGEGR